MNAIPKITVRPILPPQYCNEPVTLAMFERWFICNHAELCRYWAELKSCELPQRLCTEESLRQEFLFWSQCQYDIARITADVALKERLRHESKDEPRQESLRDYQRREFD